LGAAAKLGNEKWHHSVRVLMNKILEFLKEQKSLKLKGSLYHFTQIKFAYNTNRIEGSLLSEDQTRYIYETNTLSVGEQETVNVDDIMETVNHFRCFDYMIETAEKPLSEAIIKEYHKLLKQSTSDSGKDWFKVGDYKSLPNMVGGLETASPSKTKRAMRELLTNYLKLETIGISEIIDFHYNFEIIHPFQDGNGRVGRLIMFKECLKNNIIPFIIEDKNKYFYYRGLKEYKTTPGYLRDTCLSAQDSYKETLKYFETGKAKKGKHCA